MLRLISLFSVTLALSGFLNGQATGSQSPEKLRILSVKPTVLFPNREPLAQIAKLEIANSGEQIVAEVRVLVAGVANAESQTLTILPDQGSYDILIPDLQTAAEVTVEIVAEGRKLASHLQAWSPQRKWKVYVVKSSHEDIGYENYIFKKQRGIAGNIDLAREIARPRVIDASGTKRNVGYHYAMETILFQRNYLEERGEREWRKFIDEEVKSGGKGLSLMAAPSGVHTHWMDYEQLARVGYPARRETRDRFGLDLKTAFIVDNPSLSWSGAQAFAASGIKYVARFGQGWRAGGNVNYDRTKVPAIFWWEAPDREHKVLFAWTQTYPMIFWWGQTNGGYYGDLGTLPARWVNNHLQMIEDGAIRGPYPYDAMIIPDYGDHETPKFDERIYRNWRAAYRFPEIKFEDPENFFSYIESKFGANLPTLRGDLNNFSADYSSIDPVSQGWKRSASRLLPAAEGLAALASLATPSFALLPSTVERTYTRMFDYDEHSWPTLPPVADEQLFNAVWVKNHEALRALTISKELFGQSSRAFGANLASRGEGTFAVFNPLTFARTSLVDVDADILAVVDLRSGLLIPTEPKVQGGRSFIARDIPSFGYALFQKSTKAPEGEFPAELTADSTGISNAFYRVSFDPASGAISSVIDKISGRELVDQTAGYRLNQLVYVHKNSRESLEGFEHIPASPSGRIHQRLRDRVSYTVSYDDAKLGGMVEQTVTLFSGVKRIDFTNRLTSIDVMGAKVYEDRYRENIFFAFPFAVEDGQIRAEYAGGVVRPYDDQLRWGSHDYLTVNRWMDVSNASGGVTLSTQEASTFHLGEIRYNRFSVDYKPAKPWLFSYAWSNRMAGLLTLDPEDLNATFSYSLTSYSGAWNSGAASNHGWDTASPLLVIPATGGSDSRWKEKQDSLLKVDKANVQLTVLKASGQAGRGLVARFIETAGLPTEFELDASALGIVSSTGTNLVEDDVGSLPVRAGKISVRIPAFGFATVRLLGDAAPSEVVNPVVGAITDSSVRISWDPVPGAEAYNIYRSDDPGSPATVYSMVGRVGGNEFTDQNLNLATNYYYRVAAVTAANREGPQSEQITALTSSANETAPSPVYEMGIVRRSHDTLIVYWRKNPEPDVARYRIYRGETEDFSISDHAPLAVVEASHYFLQIYRDQGLAPGRTYYYKVQPVDWADNVQSQATVAGSTTPLLR